LDGGDALQDETVENVATKMALHIHASNMTRVMILMGILAMITAMKA
jgi:hypothetical protein